MNKGTRGKHSYIPFYMDDWAAATAHMPRVAWSVLFQICQYNWDKVEPVPPGRLKLMIADLGSEGEEIINALVESGSLEVGDKGAIFSPRAMRVGQASLDLWTRKSAGGQNSKSGDKTSTLPALIEDSSEHSSEQSSEESATDPEPDPEPDKEEEESDSSKWDFQSVVGAWNEMAEQAGLKCVWTMTTRRIALLTARMKDHGGAQALIAGIKLIPSYPFLLGQDGDRGFVASFDWFLKEDSLIRIIEGLYEPRQVSLGGQNKRTGVTAQTAEGAAKANERLAQMGSVLRWVEDGGEWVLKPGNA